MLFALGDYDVEEELGRGAFGRVYRATHRPTGTARALKVIEGALDPEALLRFEREVETLARVGGAGVVPVHEARLERERAFVVLGLMSGGSLRQRLARAGRLEWREAAGLVAALARALERCHAAGVIHRDLKPDNVLFDDEGRPRLADFGIVRDLQAASLTQSGTSLGTPAYMAPEQLEGERADARGDVYALGVVLHELVSGTRPFRATGLLAQVKEKRGSRPPLGVAGTPRDLDALLDRALAPRAEDRIAGATELRDSLERLLAGTETAGSGRSRLWLWLVIGLVVAIGLSALLARRPEAGAVAASPVPTASSPAPSRSPSRADDTLVAKVQARTVEEGDLIALAAASDGPARLEELASSAAVLSRSVVSDAVRAAWKGRGADGDLEVLGAVAVLANPASAKEWEVAFAKLGEVPLPSGTIRKLRDAGNCALELAAFWEQHHKRPELWRKPVESVLATLDELERRQRPDLIRAVMARLEDECGADLAAKLAVAPDSCLGFVLSRPCFVKIPVFEALTPRVAAAVVTYRRADLFGPENRQLGSVLEALRRHSAELERRSLWLEAAEVRELELRRVRFEESESVLERVEQDLRSLGASEVDQKAAALEIRHAATLWQATRLGGAAWLEEGPRERVDGALDRWAEMTSREAKLATPRVQPLERSELRLMLAFLDLALGRGPTSQFDETESLLQQLVEALGGGNRDAVRARTKELLESTTSIRLRALAQGVEIGLGLTGEAAIRTECDRAHLVRRGFPGDGVIEMPCAWLGALVTFRRLGPSPASEGR